MEVLDDAFKERLQEFLNAENMTSMKFAEIMEISPSNISHFLSGRNRPNFDFMARFTLRFPSVNLSWFLNGQGPMYISSETESPAVPSKQESLPEPPTDLFSYDYSTSEPQPVQQPSQPQIPQPDPQVQPQPVQPQIPQPEPQMQTQPAQQPVQAQMPQPEPQVQPQPVQQPEPLIQPQPAQQPVQPQIPQPEPLIQPQPVQQPVQAQMPQPEPLIQPQPVQQPVQPQIPQPEPQMQTQPAQQPVQPQIPQPEPQVQPQPAQQSVQPQTTQFEAGKDLGDILQDQLFRLKVALQPVDEKKKNAKIVKIVVFKDDGTFDEFSLK